VAAVACRGRLGTANAGRSDAVVAAGMTSRKGAGERGGGARDRHRGAEEGPGGPDEARGGGDKRVVRFRSAVDAFDASSAVLLPESTK